MDPGTPSTVVDQTGLAANFVGWVADAWDDLQMKRPRWRWMRRRAYSTPTTANVSVYLASALGITSFGRWLPDYELADGSLYNTMTCYLQSQGVAYEGPLTYLPYESFSLMYLRGSVSASIPAAWTIDPETGALVLGPAPNAAYILGMEFIKGKQARLALDATVPELPLAHHNLLAYLGLLRAQNTDGATALAIQTARDYVDTHMRILEREQYTVFTVGGDPIA